MTFERECVLIEGVAMVKLRMDKKGVWETQRVEEEKRVRSRRTRETMDGLRRREWPRRAANKG